MRKLKKPRKPSLPQYVVLKSGQWHVRRTFPSTETYPNGSPKRIEVTRRCVPETPERAAELAAAIHAAMYAEKAERERPRPVSEYILTYLEVKRRSVTVRTYNDYVQLHGRYIAGSPLARTVIGEVRPRDIQNFISRLQADGVSPAMIRKVFVLLSMTFRQAVIWEDIAKNPAVGILLPKIKESESRAFTRDEVRRLVAALREDAACLIFEFTLETGLRPQEAIALSWPKVDLVHRRVRIDRAVSSAMKGGGFEIKEPKTHASVRTVSFSEYMRDRLIGHRKRQADAIRRLKRLIAAPLCVPPDYIKGVNYEKRKAKRAHRREILRNFIEYDLVFPASNGLPHALNNLNRREFKSALIRAGIDPGGYSFKSLRHTNASIMAEKVNPKRLQRHLGHSNITTSLKFYTHVDDDDQSDFNQKLTDAIY